MCGSSPGAISEIKRSEASPRRSRKWSVASISNRFSLPHFGATRTGIWPAAEVNKQKRGLDTSETILIIQEWALGFVARNPLGKSLERNTRCVSRVVAVHSIQDTVLGRHERLSVILYTLFFSTVLLKKGSAIIESNVLKQEKRKENSVQTTIPLELPSNGVSHIFCKQASRQLHLDRIRNCT